MSKNKSFIFVAATLVAAANTASGAESSTGRIERLYVNLDTIYVRLVGDSCNNVANNEYYYVRQDTPQAKNWYALMLLATAQEKPISIRVTSCASGHKAIDYLVFEP